MEGLGGTATIQASTQAAGGNRGVVSRSVQAAQQKASKVPAWQGVVAYFPNALLAVAAISKMGAEKHNGGILPTKWRDYPAEVYADALARHLFDESKGYYDSESAMLHAGHLAWNALARLEKLLENIPLKAQ
jgi:hypothetical protein